VSVSERDDTGMSDLVKGLAQALFIVVCKNITEGGGADQKSAPERPHGRVVPYCGLVCIYVYISYMYINIYIVTYREREREMQKRSPLLLFSTQLLSFRAGQ